MVSNDSESVRASSHGFHREAVHQGVMCVECRALLEEFSARMVLLATATNEYAQGVRFGAANLLEMKTNLEDARALVRGAINMYCGHAGSCVPCHAVAFS